MALLSLAGVTKRFGGLVAVDDVSFEIDTGELVAIVGPNGAWKTTLFNTISGVFYPEEGTITFDGRDFTRMRPYRRARLGLARTFQISRPFASATVRENVAIGAMFGSRASRTTVVKSMEIADHYLELMGLVEHRDKPAERLTPVEKKLMGIARALAMHPRMLLLDESMAGMNPKAIDGMVQLLRTVRETEEIAIVGVVEHIMRAVVGLTERVIVMHQGARFLDAPTREALGDPRVVEIYLGKGGGAHGADAAG